MCWIRDCRVLGGVLLSRVSGIPGYSHQAVSDRLLSMVVWWSIGGLMLESLMEILDSCCCLVEWKSRLFTSGRIWPSVINGSLVKFVCGVVVVCLQSCKCLFRRMSMCLANNLWCRGPIGVRVQLGWCPADGLMEEIGFIGYFRLCQESWSGLFIAVAELGVLLRNGCCGNWTYYKDSKTVGVQMYTERLKLVVWHADCQ